jgi:hypothetical protein
MRVLFRGVHSSEPAMVVSHRLDGCPEAVSRASELIRSGAEWAEALVLGSAVAVRESAQVSTLAFSSFGRVSCPEPLYSWVIG